MEPGLSIIREQSVARLRSEEMNETNVRIERLLIVTASVTKQVDVKLLHLPASAR